MQQINGTNNIADALTKKNRDNFRKLNQTCAQVVLNSYIIHEAERVKQNRGDKVESIIIRLLK